MSIGNLKDSGNQGNNFPWQHKVLQGLQGIINSQDTCCTDNGKKLDTIIETLAGVARTPVVDSVTGSGSTPSAFSVSIANVGAAAGVVNGASIPAGTTLNFDPGMNNTVDPMSYNATGTTFLIISLQ